EKLAEARKQSKENESVVCGVCTIEGIKTAIFVMDPFFMMGSMGSVTGEKITRLFEYATDNSLPVVGCCVSGGARMQEGILSLMQMAKVSAAVKRHSDMNNLYLCVLTDPTSGGVTASFAMQADIILSEPKALVCFAGPRVIEQTIRKKVPDDIQRAECVMENGFIDNIVGRKSQKSYIGRLLKMHMRYEV
ncbi:MAG: acetyl-CoA carboxylase carboxyl transferase subunit beta, partial [Clostridiaceae bacterium]|nr:acetyl-CoA carboxylase carboxyl transferase subunit beta [Clostridiaceae bacterium]